MGDMDAILAEVRFLATRGKHHLIVARYGHLDDPPQDDLWNSTDLLYEIGRAFGMLGNEDKVERYLLRCAELAPRRAAVFHCAIGWYFQRKKKWTKALRWYDRALTSFPTYHLCLFRRGYCLEKLHRPREAVEALERARATSGSRPAPSSGSAAAACRSRCCSISRACCATSATSTPPPTALDACRRLDARHRSARHPPRAPARLPGRAAAPAGRPRRRARPLRGGPRDRSRRRATSGSGIGRVHELRGDIDDARGGLSARRSRCRAAPSRTSRSAASTLHVTHDSPGRGRRARRGAPASSRAPSRSSGSSSRGSSSPAAGRRRRYAQVEQALACRREGGFAEALRLAAELAERLGRPAEAAPAPAPARAARAGRHARSLRRARELERTAAHDAAADRRRRCPRARDPGRRRASTSADATA